MADGSVAGIALLLALMPSSGTPQPQQPIGQGAQCRVPAALPAPRMERPRTPSDVRRMPIGGYTLALSWSPNYCAGRNRGGGTQCDGSAGRFGFILHGLWPEGKGGRGWPQYCAPATILPKAVLAAQFCTMPSVQLMQHEWAKHGTCMARRPEEYFSRGRSLYQQVRFPDMAELARQKNLTAGTLARAFSAHNRGMGMETIRVRTDKAGYLSEMWVCLDTAFQPTRCPAGKSGAALSSPIRIRLPAS
ncbi:MAG: ribonuclease T [Sphingobium sp.]